MWNRVFRPDPKYETKLRYNVLAVFVICILPFVFLAFIPGAGWAYVGWFLLGNAIWIGIAMAVIGPYCRSVSYELTDEEVRVHKGIITHTVQTVPFAAVTNVELKRGPFDRLLGLGTINVHTAGYSQQSTAEASLTGIADYDEVAQTINDAVRGYRARGGPSIVAGPGPTAEAAPSGAEDTLKDILAELRALRSDLTASK